MYLFSLIFTFLYLSGITYLFLSSNKKLKNKVKLLAGILLLIFFNIVILQPELKTEVIRDHNKMPILLIDNSASMNQFNSKQSLKTFLSFFGDSLEFKTYTFGSNINNTEIEHIAFNDTFSYFPTEFLNKNNHRPVILLTDGLFNHQLQINDINKSTNSFYLPLIRIKHNSFIELQTSPNIEGETNKKTLLPITISGYSDSADKVITINVHDQNSLLASQKVTLPSGNYTINPIIKIPPIPPGRHLIKTSIDVNNKTIDIKESTLSINPILLKVFLEYRIPSLDYRFLKLAIQNRKDFKISNSKESDISIFFNGTFTNTNNNNNSSLNFIFGKPDKKSTTIELGSNAIELESEDPLFMSFNSVPAPAELFQSRSLAQSIIHANIENKRVPILSKKVINNKIQINLNINGFWSWDFTDDYSTNISNTIFTDVLLTYLKDNTLKTKLKKPLIHYSNSKSHPMSEEFTIYHPLNKPSNRDSLFVFIANKKGVQKLLRAKQLNTILEKDTLIIKKATLHNDQFLFKLKYGDKTYEVIKEIPKLNINSEVSSNDQNSFFLDNISQKIDLQDTVLLKSLFRDQASNKYTITKIIKFERNWILLIITIALLSIIWIIKED